MLNALIGNKLKEKGAKMYVAFANFMAAFDSIDRKIMLEKIRKYGIRGRMFRMIKEIYKETKALVQVGNERTKISETNLGVRGVL